MRSQIGMRSAVALLVVAACSLALIACREKESASKPGASATLRKDRYTVRGVVVMVPSADNPAAEFQVRHEAMPHFVGQDGALGMDTMTMPFPLAEGLSLEGISPGDKIELAFDVDFDSSSKQLMGYRAVRVSVLPPETALDFSPLGK